MASASWKTKPRGLCLPRSDTISTLKSLSVVEWSTMLVHDQSHWPTPSLKAPNPTVKEQRPGKSLLVNSTTPQTWDLLDRYSSLYRFLRITALSQRSVDKFKRTAPSLKEKPLDNKYIDRATHFWIQHIQQAFFMDTINTLSKTLPLSKSHPLARLPPFLDHTGTSRLGGRLKHSYLDPNSKNPVILPEDSTLSRLLIADPHIRTLHGGTQLTVATRRKRYKILGGRIPVRSHILKCIPCARYRSTRAQLPWTRVT